MNYQGRRDQHKGKGLFSGTIAVLLTALLFMASTQSTYSQSPEVRKAFRYHDIEQPSKMIPALEKAVQANPEETYYLGLGYIMTGNLDKALAAFEKGISADDKNPVVVAGKGHVKLLQKKNGRRQGTAGRSSGYEPQENSKPVGSHRKSLSLRFQIFARRYFGAGKG